MIRRPPRSPLLPYTTLFRSAGRIAYAEFEAPSDASFEETTEVGRRIRDAMPQLDGGRIEVGGQAFAEFERSEEHTSELQSRQYLVCRLLLEKKKGISIPGNQ